MRYEFDYYFVRNTILLVKIWNTYLHTITLTDLKLIWKNITLYAPLLLFLVKIVYCSKMLYNLKDDL